MSLIASFNGGPSQGSFILAAALAFVAGLIVGRSARSFVAAFFYAFLGAAAVSCICLVLGNLQGDASGLFLVGALVIFCPILGILSALLAMATYWLMGLSKRA